MGDSVRFGLGCAACLVPENMLALSRLCSAGAISLRWPSLLVDRSKHPCFLETIKHGETLSLRALQLSSFVFLF